MWSRLARLLPFALALLAAAPASAAIFVDAPLAPSPSPEAMRLSVEVAHRMFGRVDWEAMLKRRGGLDSIGARFDQLKVRPHWGEFARQAIAEDFAAGAPEVDKAMGRVVARHFTLDELRAGAELLRGPAGDALEQAVADATAGRAVTPPPEAAKAALRAANATPAGAAFIQKIGHLREVMPEADEAVGAAVALAWLDRFYVKAAAAEATPAPAVDEKERLAGQLTRLMFQAVDFNSLMQRKLGPGLEQSFSFEPGWADLMRSAVADEFGADSDALERAGGRVFSRYFTPEELRAGVDVLGGPDGAAFAQAVASGVNGGPAPSADALNRATMALQRTPAGLAFMKKLEASGEAASTEIGEEYGAVAILRVLHRFLQAAEAASAPAG